MLSLLCFTLLLIGESLASPSANQYIDTVVFEALRSVIRNEKLDPTFLPDYTYEYTDKTFMGKAKGKVVYTEGTLTGLSGVQRYSECQGPNTITGRTVINCTLNIFFLKTSYKGKVKYGVLPKVTIQAKGDVENTIFDVEVAKPYNQGIQVTLNFRSIKSIKTEFTGLGPLNNNMQVLEDNYKAHLPYEIADVINNRLRYAFEIAATQVPMPLR